MQFCVAQLRVVSTAPDGYVYEVFYVCTASIIDMAWVFPTTTYEMISFDIIKAKIPLALM